MLKSIKEELKKAKEALEARKIKIKEVKKTLEGSRKKQKEIFEKIKKSKKNLLYFHIKLLFLYVPYLFLIFESRNIGFFLLIYSVFHIGVHLHLIHKKHKAARGKIEAYAVTESMIYSFIQVVIIFGIFIYISETFVILDQLLYKAEELPLSLFDFIYFSIITISTVGYGDISPIHWFSKSITILEIAIGVWFLIILIPTMISLKKEGIILFNNLDIEIEGLENDMEELDKETSDMDDLIEQLEKEIEELEKDMKTK